MIRELYEQSALELGALLQKRELSAVELTRAALDGAARVDGDIHAFTCIDADGALIQAKQVQKRLDGGDTLSPIAGVPMAVKDNICTAGVATTCGSKMLESFVPPYSATVIERLHAAGAVGIGKLNMDEFAMGGSTETAYTGPTANPWDLDRVPGGSSGGAAAAVAAGQAVYALGSDTGGSIRQPCAFCGVTGIKPTYGAVSRYGLIAYASSLDQIGPVGRDVADCAAVLDVIAGFDDRDSTSVRQEWQLLTGELGKDIKGMRVGVPTNYFAEGLEAEVRDQVLRAAAELKSMGAELEEFELPLVEYAVPAYYIIACAEASSNLSRYDGVKYGYRSAQADSIGELYARSRSEGFGAEVKRRIMLGAFVLSSGYYDAYYKKGLQTRALIKKAFDAAFERFDMILSPNAPTTAYKMGENITDPLKMYLGDIYTVSVNLAGLPAVSLPCGFDSAGLPIGMQLIGRAFGEPELVRTAHAYQRVTDYHKRRPAHHAGGEQA